MPYIIDVASMDFPDGAQRFNWCNCQSPAALAAGLSGFGDASDFQNVNMPVTDWTVSDEDILATEPNYSTALTTAQAAASGDPIASLLLTIDPSGTLVGYYENMLTGQYNTYLLIGGAVLAWWFFFRKGRRR